MSSWKVNLFGIRDGFISLIVAETEAAFLQTTVLELKRKIHDQVKEIEPEHMRLLFAGKQLDKDGQTLKSYNIQNNSSIQIVVRVPGGTTKYRVQPPPTEEKQHKEHSTSDFSLKFTTVEPDAITGDDPDGQPRVKMSCGHAVDPNSLTMWCRSLIDKQEFKLYCPAVVDGKKKRCEKEWQYAEVRKVALLNVAECKYFETRLSEYAASMYCDLKECPGCRSFVERLDLGNLRVHCTICKKDKGRNYDFCWNCLQEWSGPTTSAVKCGDSRCIHPDLPSVRDAPMFELNEENVPLRRACPTCGKVVEHLQEGCKYVICPRCHNEYCFMCLELKEQCLKTAPKSWFGKCSKPVAPKQTTIPIWSRRH